MVYPGSPFLNQRHRIPHPAMFIALVILLNACGGGGGGSSTSTPQVVVTAPQPEPAVQISFTRVMDSGMERSYDFLETRVEDEQFFSGGVAAADYDSDGDIDLYFVGGETDPNHFYQNQGNGTFVEIADSIGLYHTNWGSGPAFGDIDGDGDLDLFVGAVEYQPYYLYENLIAEEGFFVDITPISLTVPNTVSATFYDYDSDGYLDLFLSHWGNEFEQGADTETVWQNNGDGSFASVSIETGIAGSLVDLDTDWSFTPNFSDIDGDGDGDLLMASDYGESQVFRNNGDGTFTNITDREVIVDQYGMGAAVADFDNDGDMDWFVTSIYNIDVAGDENGKGAGGFGNRLYRNDGSGIFDDWTETAGVHDGGWGWGSCATDFDNDGFVDIVHVNGWVETVKDHRIDQIRLFHNKGDFTFEEQATDAGLTDTGQGRGIVCFDAERDGDVDIVISNNSETGIVFYRNDTDNDNHYLDIRLEGSGNNRFGVGAHITVTTGDTAQVRELGGRNNFVSHNPYEVHFGLANETVADVLVRWPDGSISEEFSVNSDQLLTISQQE